jgi:hypothetical protein
MTETAVLRECLLNLIDSGDAHKKFDAAVAAVPAAQRGRRPPGGPHSPWELLEHMRIAQEDILHHVLDANWVSPEFPDGYWPASPEPPDATAWKTSVARFRDDRASVADLIRDESTDLLATIPHAGATLLAKILLIADHNAYHLGQLVLTRRMLAEE